MSDISYWCEEFTREINELVVAVEEYKGLVEDGKIKESEKLFKTCESLVSHVKETKKSFNLELRLLKDKAQRGEFSALGKQLDDKLTLQSRTLQDTRTGKNKKDLMKEANKTAEFSLKGKNNDEVLREADKVQDLTFASLGRTRMLIEESKVVGAATIDTLRGQREQIVDIEAEIDVIDSNLLRAEKLIGNFARRMATDRIIQAFTAINIVVMLGLVLYVAISGKSLSPNTSSGGTGGPATGTLIPSFRPTFNNISTTRPSFAPSLAPLVLDTDVPSATPTATSSSFEPSTMAPTATLSVLPSAEPTATI